MTLALAVVTSLAPALVVPATAATATVTGTITRVGTPDPLAGVSVTVFSDLGAMSSATTDDNGHYELQVSGDTAQVTFASHRTIRKWYGGGEDRSTAATIALAGTVDVSAELKDAGRITGTYSGATSAYFTSSRVDGEATSVSGSPSGGTFEGWVTTEKPIHLGLRLTADQGSFELWNGAKFSRQHSDPIQVDSGTTVAGLHFAYPETATLTGRTTNTAGLPVRLSYVADVLEDGDWIRVRNGRTTPWGGEFSAVVPASIPVTIRAGSPNNTEGFLETWLGDTQDVTQAQTIVSATGAVTDVGDITVAGGEVLVGAVQDKGGKPVPGITVEAFRGRTDELLGTTTTDEIGAYAIPGLGADATGEVTVRFSGERIVTSWGRNRASQAEADQIGFLSWNAGTQTVTHLPEFQVETAPPTLTGSGLVGSTVTATPGSAVPVPTDTEIWWYCGATPLGVEGHQYLVTASDAGCSLTARQLSILEGHGTGVAVSTPVSTKRFEMVDDIHVTGNRIVGTRLHVTTPTWSAPPDRVSYQWFRGSTPIAGASAPSYVPTLADIGRFLSVHVTGHRTAEAIATTRRVPALNRVRARTSIQVIRVVPRRGRAIVTLRLSTPGITRPGGAMVVSRAESGGGQSSVTRLPVTSSPTTLRFTYRSHSRWNRLIFVYPGTVSAGPAWATARVPVRR